MANKKYAFAKQYEHYFVTLVINPFVMYVCKPFMPLMLRMTRKPKDLEITTFEVKGTEGKKVKSLVIQPKGVEEDLPCIINFHGGAFCYDAAPYQLKYAFMYAQKCRCRVVFPNYHLMPKYIFPHAFTDAEAVTEYVLSNTESLKIQKDNIIVFGDSAGGALAAYIANRYGEKLKAEMLLYPVTEYGTDDESMREFYDTPMWNSKKHKKLMARYLKGFDPEEYNHVAPLYSPIKETIPTAYVETARFDCLHSQGERYAQRLKDQGVDTIYIPTQGTPHGYDMDYRKSLDKDFIKSRISFVNNVFYRTENVTESQKN